jgi:hypothetical protein
MITYENALKCAVEGDAVFLIGSGFSTGAENALDGEEGRLLVGSALAKKLAELTGLDPDEQLDIVSQEYIDMYGEAQLIDYLKSHYTVNSYAEYYKSLARVKNLKVYSTNYDDLIEKVCKDCGITIKGYGIDADIRKVNKNKMVMHLNGYIKDLENNVLPDSFKLSHLSYNNYKFFDTPWYSYLIDELYSAKVIFIIGLSFGSDLDIRRIVSDKELKDKIFFVERSNLSAGSRKFLDKYGRVLLCGVQTFLEDLSKIEIDEDRKKEVYYKSFRKAGRYDNSITPEDRDVYALLFNGVEKEGIYKKDADRCYEALVNRDKVSDVVREIEQGNSVVIHSDLGNGKSLFVNQVIDLCSNLDFYYLKQINNQKVLSEIRSFCNDGKEKVLICDPANIYIDILNKFADFDLKNVRFILVMRSSMYDNYFNTLYDVIERMSNVKFVNPICLDVLSDGEIELLDKLILKYGFYGNLAGLSVQRRLEFLKSKCKSRFQNILISLFESTHIIDRFVENIANINGNTDLRRILILAFVSGILELGLNTNDYKILLGIQDVERVIRRNQNCGEIVDIESGKIVIKSSIIAKELMMNTEIFTKNEVFDVLIDTMKRLDTLYLGSDKYKNAMINLVSCSYLSYVFGYKMESNKFIEYYEKVKELNFCKKNLFFWEQYAIVCVNLNQFDRAGRYFETAYSLAKQKGHLFSAYQIDNHYARYLLASQLYYRKEDDSLKVFLEAHRLLNKNSEIDKDKKNNRYYKFRVARVYKDYYDAFASKYGDEDKDVFVKRCQEMYYSLLQYKKGLDKDEIRNDVRECETSLKYILESENRLY